MLDGASTLRYHDATSAASATPDTERGAVTLSQRNRVVRPSNRDPANRMHPFDLVVGARTYRLAAYTAPEADAWCAVLTLTRTLTLSLTLALTLTPTLTLALTLTLTQTPTTTPTPTLTLPEPGYCAWLLHWPQRRSHWCVSAGRL